ncbi:tetratricopeptide repeat protein, partial [bacterium]|nr:tetratricopeptide repeat protein [bacterium]
YAFITEYSTGIIYLLLLVYLWGSLISKKRIRYFLLGSSAPILFLLFYNYTCFGHPFTSGYAYEVIPSFREGMRGGFMGLTHPSLYSLFLITFSPARGIFWLSPFLLLSFPGLYHFFRSREYRREFLLFSGIIAGYFLFNCSYYLPGGGWAPGPRHLVPMLPFLCVLPIFALEKQGVTFRKIFVPLVLLSLLFIFLVVSTSPHVPPVFTNTLFEFSRPLFLKGQLAQNGGMLLGTPEALSLLPLLLLLGILFFLLRKGLPKKRKEKERKGSLINFLICLGIILLVGVMAQIGVQEKAVKHHFLGVVYQDKNQLYEAKEKYAKALDMKPDFYLSYNQLAAIYLQEGKESEAIEMWKESLKINPRQPTIWKILKLKKREW